MPGNTDRDEFEPVGEKTTSSVEKATEGLTRTSRDVTKSVIEVGAVIGLLTESFDKLVREVGGVYGKFVVDLIPALGKVTENFAKVSTSINTLNQQLYEFATYTFTPLNESIRSTAWNISITTERFSQLYESLRKVDATGTISIATINSITDTLKKIYPIGGELAERVTRVAEITSRYPTLAPYVATGKPIPSEEINLLLRQYGESIRDALLDLAAYQKAVYTRERIEYPGRRLEEVFGRFDVRLDEFFQRYGINLGRLEPKLATIVEHLPMLLISLKALGFGIEKFGAGLKGEKVSEGVTPLATVLGSLGAFWVRAKEFRNLTLGLGEFEKFLGKPIRSFEDLGEIAEKLNVSWGELTEAFPEVEVARRRLHWLEPLTATRGFLVGTTFGSVVQAGAAGLGRSTWEQTLYGTIAGGIMGGLTGGPWGAALSMVSNAAMGIWNIMRERQQQDLERKQLEKQQKQTNALYEAQKANEITIRMLSILETRLTDVKFSLELVRASLEYMGRVGYAPGAVLGAERQVIGLERTIGEARMREAQEAAKEAKGWTADSMNKYLEGLQMVYDAMAKEVELAKKRVEYVDQARNLTDELASAIQNEGYLLSQSPRLMQARVNLLESTIRGEKEYLSTLKDANSVEGLRVQTQIAIHTMQLDRLRFETEVLQRLKDQATILEHNKGIYNSFLGIAQELHLPWSIQMNYAKNVAEYSRQIYENARAQYEAAVQNNRPIAEQMKLQEAMVGKAKEYIDAITYARRSIIEQMATGFLGVGGATRGIMPVLTPEGAYKGPAYFEGARLGTTEGRPLGLTWQDVMEKMYGTIEEQQNLFESMVVSGKESVKLVDSIDVKLDSVNESVMENLPKIPEAVNSVIESFNDVGGNINTWLNKGDALGGLPVFVTNIEGITRGIASEAQKESRKDYIERRQEEEKKARPLLPNFFDHFRYGFQMDIWEMRHMFFPETPRKAMAREQAEEYYRNLYIEPKIPSIYKTPEKYSFQEGGIVERPTTALVGEAGPEAIIPLREDKVNQYLGFARPQVNVTAKVYIGNREIKDYIYEAFIDAVKS